MANRFPLIIDTDDGNKFKELPVGDNLNLQGSSIVNASSIEVLGNLDVQSLTVNEQTLSTVAVTGSYNDLDDVPVAFSGSYNDLSNKPSIPTQTKNLTDVSLTDPTDGQILVFNSANGTFEPKDQTDIDLSTSSINDLQDVITTGTTELKYLKYQSGAWRPGNINYSEILNKPTNVSSFINDIGYLDATVFASGPDVLTIDATVEFTGENTHLGIENFSNRVDFVGDIYFDNAAGTVNINSDAIVLNGNGSLLVSTNGDMNIQGIGLLISDPGGGSTIEDLNGLSISGPLSFENANISSNIEAPAFKGNLLGTNLVETVLVDASTFEANFNDLTLTGKLSVSVGADPASNIGAPGDTEGEIRIGPDTGAATRYLYFCSADYDGATAIWYRVAMTNNW